MSDFEEPTFTTEDIVATTKPVEEDVIEENEKIKEPRKPIETSLIPIGADGRVVARNNAELMRYCGAVVTGGGVPTRFDTPHKLFAALMFVRDLRLPDTAIRQVANVHGVMCAFGDLPLSMAQRSGEITHFKEQWFDAEYRTINFENKNLTSTVFGSVTFIARKGAEVQSFSFTMDDAKACGMYPAKRRDGSANSQAPWMVHTRMMLRYKARSIALKSICADLINGVGIAEYDFDVMPGSDSYRDVTPETDKADAKAKIREKLRGEK